MSSYRRLIILTGVICLSASSALARDWKEHKGQHFIIYYNEAPFSYVETVEESAERYYREIAEDMGFTRYKSWSWDNRASIYIYDDMDDFVTEGRQANWSHGVASPRDKVIRTYPSSHGFFDSTLPHELAHIIFREFIGFDAQLPSWFEEGVAMNQEKAQRWGAHDKVREAMNNGTFKSLDELTVSTPRYRTSRDMVNLFYSESASAVNFLINEYGGQRFVRFCRKLKEGTPFNWALDEVYVRFKNTADLNDAWVKFLKDE